MKAISFFGFTRMTLVIAMCGLSLASDQIQRLDVHELCEKEGHLEACKTLTVDGIMEMRCQTLICATSKIDPVTGWNIAAGIRMPPDGTRCGTQHICKGKRCVEAKPEEWPKRFDVDATFICNVY